MRRLWEQPSRAAVISSALSGISTLQWASRGGKKPVISGKELLSDGRKVGCAVRYCLLHPANRIQQTPVSLLGFCLFGNSKPSVPLETGTVQQSRIITPSPLLA